MEGRDKIIQLGGIIRNTSNSTAEDGEFEEIINLRYKDGRFIPMNEQKDVDGLENVRIQYKWLFVHSNNFQHFLGYDDGAVWYFADMDDDAKVTLIEPVRLFDVEEGEQGIQYTQTGNIVSVLGVDKIKYLYWRNGKYVIIDADFNGMESDEQLPPEGLIQFRQAHKKFDNGENLVRVHLSDTIKYSSAEDRGIAVATMMIKARDLSLRKGEPTGYYYVCSALKLYDGTYILQSRPVLMRAEPNFLNRNNIPTAPGYGYQCRRFCYLDGSDDDPLRASRSKTTNKNLSKKTTEYVGSESSLTYYDCSLKGWDTSNDPENVGIGDSFLWQQYQQTLHQADGTVVKNFEKCASAVDEIPDLYTIGFADTYGDNAVRTGGVYYNGKYQTRFNGPTELSLFYNANTSGYDGSINDPRVGKWKNTFAVLTMPRELQVKFNRPIPKEWEDIVESVCVFITPQQDMFGTSSDDFASSLISQAWQMNSAQYVNACPYKLYVPISIGNITEWKTFISNINRSANFYKVAEYPLAQTKTGEWMSINMERDGILKNLVQQERLNLDAADRNAYLPKTMLMYNGKQHIANYTTRLFSGWPFKYFWSTEQASGKLGESNYDSLYKMSCYWVDENAKQINIQNVPDLNALYDASGKWKELGIPCYAVEYFLDTADGERRVVRYQFPDSPTINIPYFLNSVLSYPDTRCTKIRIHLQYVESKYVLMSGGKTGYKYNFVHLLREFPLTIHPSISVAYYMNQDASLITVADDNWVRYALVMESADRDSQPYYTWKHTLKTSDFAVDNLEYRVNGLKVSHIDNPFYFPTENTYKVGNQQIIALATNSILVSEGQVGDTPLYVFTKDGVYGLFVDASGEVTYKSSRPLTRDVCLSWQSVTYTDEGVAFLTDRGLKLIVGAKVDDISDPIEGKFYDFTNAQSDDFHEVMTRAISEDRLVQLSDYVSKEEIMDYLKIAVIGYNHRDREIWVSNPARPYSYVLSGGRWLKRSQTADEYVCNYPETYTLKDGRLTYLGVETNSGNEVMALTRSIKFDTQQFKQAYRAVMRCHLKTHGVNDLLVKTIYAEQMNFDPFIMKLPL